MIVAKPRIFTSVWIIKKNKNLPKSKTRSNIKPQHQIVKKNSNLTMWTHGFSKMNINTPKNKKQIQHKIVLKSLNFHVTICKF